MNRYNLLRFFGETREKIYALDLHPTLPWVVSVDASANTVIWDYNDRVLVHEFSPMQEEAKLRNAALLRRAQEPDCAVPSKPEKIGNVRYVSFIDEDARKWKGADMSLSESHISESPDSNAYTVVLVTEYRVFFYATSSRTGKSVHSSDLDGQSILSACIVPCRPWIALGCKDGTVRLWNWTASSWGIEDCLTAGHQGKGVCELFSFVGRSGIVNYISSATDGSVCFWSSNGEVKTRMISKLHESSVPLSMSMNLKTMPKSGEIVSIGGDRTIITLDASSGEECNRVSLVKKRSFTDSTFIHSASLGGSILLLAEKSPLIRGLFSPMSKKSPRWSEPFFVIDLASQLNLKRLKVYSLATHVFAGSMVAFGSNHGVIVLELGRLPPSIASPSPLHKQEMQLQVPTAYSVLGDHIACTTLTSRSTSSATTLYRDIRTRPSPVRPLSHPGKVTLSLSPSGQLLGVLYDDVQQYEVLALSRDTPAGSYVCGGSAVSIVWHSSEDKLAVAEPAPNMTIGNTNDERFKTLRNTIGICTPNPSVLSSASGSGSASATSIEYLCEVKTSEQVRLLHGGPLLSVVYGAHEQPIEYLTRERVMHKSRTQSNLRPSTELFSRARSSVEAFRASIESGNRQASGINPNTSTSISGSGRRSSNLGSFIRGAVSRERNSSSLGTGSTSTSTHSMSQDRSNSRSMTFSARSSQSVAVDRDRGEMESAAESRKFAGDLYAKDSQLADPEAQLQLFAWDGETSVGPLLPVPHWLCWEPTRNSLKSVRRCVLAYEHDIVFIVVGPGPKLRTMCRIAVQEAMSASWFEGVCWVVTSSDILCAFPHDNSPSTFTLATKYSLSNHSGSGVGVGFGRLGFPCPRPLGDLCTLGVLGQDLLLMGCEGMLYRICLSSVDLKFKILVASGCIDSAIMWCDRHSNNGDKGKGKYVDVHEDELAMFLVKWGHTADALRLKHISTWMRCNLLLALRRYREVIPVIQELTSLIDYDYDTSASEAVDYATFVATAPPELLDSTRPIVVMPSPLTRSHVVGRYVIAAGLAAGGGEEAVGLKCLECAAELDVCVARHASVELARRGEWGRLYAMAQSLSARGVHIEAAHAWLLLSSQAASKGRSGSDMSLSISKSKPKDANVTSALRSAAESLASAGCIPLAAMSAHQAVCEAARVGHSRQSSLDEQDKEKERGGESSVSTDAEEELLRSLVSRWELVLRSQHKDWPSKPRIIPPPKPVAPTLSLGPAPGSNAAASSSRRRFAGASGGSRGLQMPGGALTAGSNSKADGPRMQINLNLGGGERRRRGKTKAKETEGDEGGSGGFAAPPPPAVGSRRRRG